MRQRCRYNGGRMKDITSKRCGDVAEMYVASLLLADGNLEVFSSISDDGHGADLAIWSARTGRWYAVQVKASKGTANPSVYAKRFRTEPGFLVAAVVLDAQRRPSRVFLVPGEAWKTDTSGCLGSNPEGGKAGPYFEVRTSSKKHLADLERYEYGRVASTL